MIIVAGRIEAGDPRAWRIFGDTRGAERIRRPKYSICVSDVELIPDQLHPIGLIEAAYQRFAHVCAPITIRVAQQQDTVAPDRAIAWIVALALGRRFGDQHVAVRQHHDVARRIQPLGKDVDGKAVGRLHANIVVERRRVRRVDDRFRAVRCGQCRPRPDARAAGLRVGQRGGKDQRQGHQITRHW